MIDNLASPVPWPNGTERAVFIPLPQQTPTPESLYVTQLPITGVGPESMVGLGLLCVAVFVLAATLTYYMSRR